MSDRRSVVLVTVDSLRADHCGYVDGGPTAAPTVADLADGGLAFERAIAPGPSTPESMPVAFTGQYPVPADGDGGLATRRERIRRHMGARETLPERLSRLGYETAAFTPNPFTSRQFGFDDGFDAFTDFMGGGRDRSALYDRVFEGFLDGDPTSSFARVLLNFWQREEVFRPWESYYDAVREWTRTAEEPYFVWLFLMDAHNPYLAGGAYRRQSRLGQFYANVEFWRGSHETQFRSGVHDRLVTAYEDAVRYADACVDRLRTDLDDAVLVVHGDHGEAFGEHGSYGHEPYLHPENVHVPLVVDGPGVPATDVRRPVSLRRLPDVVAGTATGDLVADAPTSDLLTGTATSDAITDAPTGDAAPLDPAPYAVTRTDQGDAAAVYTADSYAVRNGNDADRNGNGEWAAGTGRSEPGRAPLEAVLAREAVFRRERGRIARAVTGVSDA